MSSAETLADLDDEARGIELDVVGRLTGRTHDFLMPLVTDEQDVVVLGGEPLRLVVHLGHQRAGRVDGLQLPHLGLPVHLGRDPVRGEHHRPALGDLVELLDEDRAARLEVRHHVLVVHDLLAHVDRGAVEVQRLLHRDHRAVHAGAVATGRRQQHRALRLVGRQDARLTQVDAHGPESTVGAHGGGHR